MSNQQTVLTALGCAGSLAAMLAITSPAVATPATTAPENSNSFDYDLSLVQSDSDPIRDALSCTCAVCTGGVQRPVF
jgi:hypothetical protein